MTTKNIRIADVLGLFTGIGLGCMVLLLLAGCSNTPKWGAWSHVPTKEQINAALGRPETFIYFTNYQIYHHPGRQEYVFWDGRNWVTTKQPPLEVTAELLEASPKTEVAFHGHPGAHHAQVSRSHPHEWRALDSFIVANP